MNEGVEIDWDFGMRQFKRRTVKQWRAAQAADRAAAPDTAIDPKTHSVLTYAQYQSFYALESDGHDNPTLRWDDETEAFVCERVGGKRRRK